MLWAFCSGGLSVHGENRNFPRQIDVGAELQNPLFFHLSHNPLLSKGLSLPGPCLSLLDTGCSLHGSGEPLCRALPIPWCGPGVLSNEIPISNNKEGGIAIWMSCLSRIKLTPK